MLKKSSVKILMVIVCYVALYKIVKLPYINILTIFFGYIPFLVALILGIILFKPKKEYLLIASFVGFILLGILDMLHLILFYEAVGVINFILVSFYMIKSILDLTK